MRPTQRTSTSTSVSVGVHGGESLRVPSLGVVNFNALYVVNDLQRG